jgi:hypothetical protein
VASLVGFLLIETQPAVLVQQAIKAGNSVAGLTPDSFSPGRVDVHAWQFSASTRNAWLNVMEDKPLTDAVLGKLDNRTIRRMALRCAKREELMAFCFDKKIDSGRIGGTTLNEMILDLLRLIESEDLLDYFVRWLAEERDRCVKAAIKEYLPDVLTS